MERRNDIIIIIVIFLVIIGFYFIDNISKSGKITLYRTSENVGEVSLTGTFAIFHIDYFDENLGEFTTGVFDYYLITEREESTKQFIKLIVPQGSSLEQYYPNDVISVTGTIYDCNNEKCITINNIENIQLISLAPERIFLDSSRSTFDCNNPPYPQSVCEQTFAIVLVNANGIPPQTDIQTALSVAEDIDSYYGSNSYGNTWFSDLENSGEPADIYEVSITVPDRCIPLSPTYINAVTSAVASYYPGINLNSYRRVLILGRQEGCPSVTGGQIGGRWSAILSNGVDFGTVITIAHELGHNLGMKHAGAPLSTCNFNVDGPLFCDYNPYGDRYDIMGAGTEGILYSFNAPHKEEAYWFTTNNIVLHNTNVDSPQTYLLDPIENPFWRNKNS